MKRIFLSSHVKNNEQQISFHCWCDDFIDKRHLIMIDGASVRPTTGMKKTPIHRLIYSFWCDWIQRYGSLLPEECRKY